MTRRFLNQLGDGDAVDDIFLLTDKQLRANRNANLYLLTSLRDCTGVLNGLMWNVTEDSANHINSGEYVRVRGKVQLYQGTLQVIVTHINTVPSEGLDPADFYPKTGVEVERLLTTLKEILHSIDDPPLKSLMECFLIDDQLMQQFSQAPAGVKAHHAYLGGLLEHVVNIMETARRIADLYPKVNLNLLLAGIFLHDLGKIRELGYESSFIYTDEGQLLGHMMIGVEILNEKVAEVQQLTGEPFPTETLYRLKHMILSHHGRLEYGSAKLPMTPEAIALHHLDNLDAKVHEFTRSIEDDPNASSNWTPYSTRLDRKLFKGESDTDDD